jgi:hypothetical protein
MGAIDVSGHCFLLCHASLTIWEELVIAWQSLHLLNTTANAVKRRRHLVGELVIETVLAAAVGSLLLAWLWMLCITCLHFHSWLEKVCGTLLALLYWRLTYAGGFGRHRNFHFDLTTVKLPVNSAAIKDL